VPGRAEIPGEPGNSRVTTDKDPFATGWEWSLVTFPCLVVSLLPWVSQLGVPMWLGKLVRGYNGAVSFLLVLLGWVCVRWAKRPGPQANMDLLERAIARFLPTHLLVVGVSILSALAFRSLGMSVFGDTPATQWLSVMANLFLVHGWFPAGLFLFFWNPHLWIAGLGLFFVQLAVPLIRGLERWLQRSRWPLWWIAAWLWAGSFALVALLQRHVPMEILDVSGRMWLFGIFPGFRVWEFALGAVGCLAFEMPHRTGGLRELLVKSPGARRSLLAACLGWNLAVVWLGLDVLGGDRGWLLSQSFLMAPAWLGILLALRSGAPMFRQFLSKSRTRELAGMAWIAMLLSPWSFWACVWLNGHGLRLWLPGFLVAWMAFTAYLIQRFWASPMERLLTPFMDRWKRRRANR
jgi:hypothetical protein